MSSPKAFLVGVTLLVLMPCIIDCSVTFEAYKRFVDSNCLYLGQIAQDICGNVEDACLPMFELVEYCEEFCRAHTMNSALLYSAVNAGNVPRLNSTMCRYCARDPTGLTCHVLTYLNNAAECLGTTTTPGPIACGSGGSPGTCVSGSCQIPLAVGTCAGAGEQCCLVLPTVAPTTEPACGTGGSVGQCVSGSCVITLQVGTCPGAQTCCLVQTTTTMVTP